MTIEEFEVIDRRGMILQDEKGRLAYAEQKGVNRLIMRLLKKRFGELPIEITSQIEDLSLENLERLGEDVLDFNSIDDLSSWLEGQ